MRDASPVGARRTGLRAAIAAGATLLLFFVLEGLASLVLAFREAQTEELTEQAHCIYDPLLGWVNRPSFHRKNLYGPDLAFTTNAQGFRGLRDVTPAVPEGTFRILCLGDSFTLGHGVHDRATIPAYLEQQADAIEAVNMGQGGYGIDQCYLWYRRDAAEIEAQLVLFLFIAPDFDRMLVERFQGVYPKPLLRLEQGELVLPTEPLPEAWGRPSGAGSSFLDHLALRELLLRTRRRVEGVPTNPVDPANPLPYRELAAAVLRDMKRLTEERGSALAFVHLPLRDRFRNPATHLTTWLSELAAELGVPFIDLTVELDAMLPGEGEALYLADGHMNPAGNRRIAEILFEKLPRIAPGLR